jgi:Fur family transcriptional regulator, ferric uptake regulator
MKKTKQKELIKEETEKFNAFFTTEELFNKVKQKDKRIGIATIYRSLKDLRNKGELHSYLCNRRTVYSKEENHHCHFTCQKCGNVKHFDIESIDFLKIKEEICHFQIDIHGTCKKCKKE